jgi:hypothetical protein
MFQKKPASIFTECKVHVPAELDNAGEQELQMEVLLVLGLAKARNQRSNGYWEGAMVDLSSTSLVSCENGCNRLFWVRKLVQERKK